MIGNKEVSDTVYLNFKQLRLFNFLKRHSADVAEWPSLGEIGAELNLSLNEIKKIIRSLRKKEGIVMHSQTTRTDGEKRVTYGLLPETLEVLIRLETTEKTEKKDFSYKALYLAEPAFGTKAFDDRYTMKGLALFLEANKEADNIQEVIIQGGVIPHIPPYSSVSYINDLRFLGYVNRGKREKSVSEKLLEGRIKNEFERDFYEEHINNPERKKITDLTDAFLAAGEQLKILMSALPDDTSLIIQFGEEDRKNVKHIENEYIRTWAKEKENQIKLRINEVNLNARKLYKKSFSTAIQRYCLQAALDAKELKIKEGIKKEEYQEKALDFFLRRDEEAKRKVLPYTKDFGKDLIGDLETGVDEFCNLTLGKKKTKYETELEKAVKIIYDAKEDRKKIDDKIRDLDKDFARIQEQKRILESKLKDLSSASSWTGQLLKGSRRPITWFTKQYPVTSDEVELIWKIAKDQYSALFYKWDIEQQPNVHVSHRKTVKVRTEVVEDVISKKKSEAKVDYEIVNGEKRILLIHNIKHVFSDAVGPGDIRDAKLMMNYENMVLRKLFEEEFENKPDIVLLGGHTSGGFRVMPWFKKSEHIIKGEFVKGQEITYLISLPTLQSIPKLEWLTEKGFRNWHTKNYEKGPYASAAILHTEDNEGVNRFMIIDTSRLIEFGKTAEEIENYRKQLKKKLPKEERKKILDLIKEKKNSVKISFRKIEAAGDFHLGSPDMLGRYSKDQLIKASQIYQIEHGLPQIVSWDEILHGVPEWFKSAARYEGMLPEKFYQNVIKKLEEADMPLEEKLRQLGREVMADKRAITIHNDSEQKRLFGLLLQPYAEKIIENGGKLIMTSGNHYNQSIKTSDEATELANKFPEEYRDSNKIEVFSGKGNDFGMGTTYLEGNQKLFVMHKFPERIDEVYGILAHLRKKNDDSDIIIGGDRHQPGVGYADGHVVIEHAGYETTYGYVDQIGKPAGIRGLTNVFYVPDKRGVYEVHFVVNPTLEKIIERENII